MTTATRTDIPKVYADEKAVGVIICKLRKRGLRPHQVMQMDETYRVWVEGEHEVSDLLHNYANGHDTHIAQPHEIISPMLEVCCRFHTCPANGLLYCEDTEVCARWFSLPNPQREGKMPEQLLPCIKLILGQKA
jgi:hypothetical protein